MALLQYRRALNRERISLETSRARQQKEGGFYLRAAAICGNTVQYVLFIMQYILC